MYFEFESIQSQSDSQSTQLSSNYSTFESCLRPRHRRISSSSQSLRELIDDENIIENITPSHCDLYLITRKKLTQISTNNIKQNHDLRREVLLTSIHRNITSKSTLNNTNNSFDITSDPIRDKLLYSNSSQLESTHNSDQHFKNNSLSLTTPTCTTTMANTIGATKMSSTSNSTTKTMTSSIKKRNLTSPTSQPNSDYEEEWKTTIKRLKVVHGIDVSYDVNMDSEFDEFCDNDLNDLTNNFHRLKTPFT